MKLLQEEREIEFIQKNKAKVWKLDKACVGGINTDPAKNRAMEIPLDEFLLLDRKMVIESELYCFDQDLSGKRTVIIRKFGSDKEMFEFLQITDMEALKKEMTRKYGRGSGFVDPITKELKITLT